MLICFLYYKMLSGSAGCVQVMLKFEFWMPTTVLVFICETRKESLSMHVLASNIFGLIQWLCNEWMESILTHSCIFESRLNVAHSYIFESRFNIAWDSSKSSWVLQTLWRWRSLNSWAVKWFISARIEFAYSRAECVTNTDKVGWRWPILWRSRMLFVLLGCSTSPVIDCGSIGEP